jgi:hypothetical protein
MLLRLPPAIRRIKCSDLDDMVILRFIHSCRTGCAAVTSDISAVLEVHHEELLKGGRIPFNLLKAKLKKLYKKELIEGCTCGCRGDYTLTLKGRCRIISEELELPKRFYQLSN